MNSLPDRFETRVFRAFDESFASGSEWDELLAASPTNTVFLLSGWLRAWHETLGQGEELILPQVRLDGRLVAAGAFQARDGILEFAGKGPSDYSDVLVQGDLDPPVARQLIACVIRAAQRAAPRLKWSRLARIPLGESLTPSDEGPHRTEPLCAASPGTELATEALGARV